MFSAASTRKDLAVLLVRLAAGLTFLIHGLDKFGDLTGTEQFFDSLGIPVPGLMAPLVATLETIGGVALIIGLLAPVFALALAGNMLVAGLTQHVENGFFTMNGGYEHVLILGVACLGIVVAGAGRFSADAALKLGDRLPGYPRDAGVA